jgi:hypothetical protein
MPLLSYELRDLVRLLDRGQMTTMRPKRRVGSPRQYRYHQRPAESRSYSVAMALLWLRIAFTQAWHDFFRVVRNVTLVGEIYRYTLETAFGTLLTLKQQHRFGFMMPAPLEHCRMVAAG